MEASAPTATEKNKHKGSGMDGSSFSDLTKKSSPTTVTRGPHPLFPTFHTPIPIDMRHHEGRYHYEPHPLHAMHGPPGLAGSPVISDGISLIRLSPHAAGTGESPFSPPHPYVNHHMEQYLRSMHSSPTLSMISAARGLSPADVTHEHLKERGLFSLPPPPPGANPTEYYHLMASGRSTYGDLLMQSGAAAAHLPDYISPVDVSRFSSPRLTPRLSRKRALSISPLSDASIDLQTMIRTSPNSLVAYINNSRSSSAASSSYGHLSVSGISPSFTFPHTINPMAYQQLLNQQRGLSAFGHTPPLIQPSPSFSARQHAHALAASTLNTAYNSSSSDSNQNAGGDPAVSSTVNPMITKRHKVKTEAEGPRPISPCSQEHTLDLSEELDKDECKQEPEVVYETNCHWDGCTKEYDTQDQLVHHINNDHIHGEKKEFVCHWDECSREQKPFKAQYMLVVHMRRHTGEKPHKCTPYVCEHEGCNKAFSNASDRAKHQNRTSHKPTVLFKTPILQKPYICKIPGCTKRYTDPSSLRKHVKTVHGPEAHVTKKQRGDVPPRGPPKGNGENEANAKHSGRGLDGKTEANSTTRGEEDCLQVKSIKTEKMMTYQSSPGGQSSCSSEPSPLGSAHNNDSGVEMALHSGGSFGDLSALDDLPMVDSSTLSPGNSAGVGLGLRKGGGVTIKLENIKKERLKNVRDSCPWANTAPQAPLVRNINTKLPPIPAVGSLLENSNMIGPLGPCPPQRFGDLSSCEVTMLNQLNKQGRRDSNTSTASSAYISRRSSGISPCYSSRRSSEASQFGGRHNNISSADSYDPISTDLSRRSSEASHCGGGGGNLPSLLSLTPAQHYRLKAKYAAATGGAPPTPLPNMERMSLRTRMALYGEHSQERESSAHSHLFHPGTGAVPRRCSDIGYGNRSVMPHEVPGNLPRRASDPICRPAPDPLSQPRGERYNSMNGMILNAAMPPFSADRRGLASQGYTRSDGSLHRHPFVPRPPSISENAVMETMAVDGMDHVGDEDLMLPDDVVQYLRSQNNDPGQSVGPADYSGGQSQGFQVQSLGSSQYAQQQQHFYGQRRMALADTNTPLSGSGHPPLPPYQMSSVSGSLQQQFPAPPSMNNKNNMPVQWNEVSSGTVDATATSRLTKQNLLRNNNLAVIQQRQNFGPFQGAASGNGNHQVMPMSQNVALHGYAPRCNAQRINPAQLHQQQRLPCGMSYTEQMSPQQGYSQEIAPIPNSADGVVRPDYGSVDPLSNRAMGAHSNPETQNYRSRTQVEIYPLHVNQVDQLDNSISTQPLAVLNGNRSGMQPRPPPEPKSMSGRQHSGSGSSVQQNIFPQSDFNPNNTSEASPKRPGGLSAHNARGNAPMFYAGQIHMFEPNSDASFISPMSPCAGQAPVGATVALASPGVNQVTSTVDSSGSGATSGIEHAQIDFDAMLDDGDHSSLMSGTLSPGLLTSLSQNSSRLTTPRNSVTLASVPAGIGNMAIGDMSSMLTALAEESKFLNMMS
uniref:C2H2-type domain-containing protein n=1 Tax=Esox lucius TaxID=8010 RepID=A0A3P8XTF9_ESOLU